ncbi:MAG: hypothetical protein AAF740_07735 [Bacteroidota bacterium]
MAKKADYILALKGNQKLLFEEVDDELIWASVKAFNCTEGTQHGRKEIRKCKVMEAQDSLASHFIDP